MQHLHIVGDALRVDILRMTPNRATGWTRASLAANVVDPETVRALPSREKVTWTIDAAAGTVRLAEPPAGLEHLVLPLEPMIGCFGVAPALGQAFSTAAVPASTIRSARETCLPPLLNSP